MSRLMIVEVPSYSCEFKGIREICEIVLCGGCKDGKEDLSCTECRRKYADKIIKILRDVKSKTERSE